MLHSSSVGLRPAKQTIYITISFFLCCLLLMTAPASDAAIEKDMVGGTARIFLDLDSEFAGWVLDTSGGYTKAVVVDYYDGKSTVTRKRVGALAVEDLEITFGIDMAPVWWQWISNVLAGNPVTHNLSVIRTDLDFRTIDQQVLRNARIKQIHFPVFDRASKDPLRFKVVITAETSRFEAASGASAPSPLGRQISLKPNSSTFQFELGDLKTDRTVRVVPPVVSVKFPDGYVGGPGLQSTSTPTLGASNMTISVPIYDSGPYMNWLRELVDGRVGADSMLQSSLSILTPDYQQVLMTIFFDSVGLASLSPYQLAADGSMGPMVLDLYLERVRISTGK